MMSALCTERKLVDDLLVDSADFSAQGLRNAAVVASLEHLCLHVHRRKTGCAVGRGAIQSALASVIESCLQ